MPLPANEDWARFFSLSGEMMCILDSAGRFVRLNPAWLQTLGWSDEELAGRLWSDLLAPRDRDASLGREAHFLARDGTQRCLAWSVTPAELGLRYCVVRDVTARRDAEQRRAAHAAVTRALAESSTIAEASPTILRALCECMNWEYGCLWLRSPGDNALHFESAWKIEDAGLDATEFLELSRRTVFSGGVGLPGRILASGEPAWIPDVGKDPNFPRAPAAVRMGLHAACGFPLRNGAQILGAMEFFTRELRGADEPLLAMMGDIGKQVGQFVARVRAEAALQGAEERLRTVVNNAPIILFALDATGQIVLSQGLGLRSLGFAPGELEGRSVHELYAGNPEVLDQVRRALAGETFVVVNQVGPATLETRFQAVRNGAGECTGTIAVSTDLSERTQAEAALRRSEARFRHLIDSIPDAIGVHRHGVFLFANPGAARFLGWAAASDLVGKETARTIHPDDHEAATAWLRQLGEAGEPGAPGPVVEVRFVRKDGSPVDAEVASISIDFDGAPAFLTIARDVTERKQMQARLVQADRMASLGTLAAGVAHEINNPLTYVLMNISSVARDLRRLGAELPALSTLDERLAEAQEGIERIGTIVRDLRTFSRDEDEQRGPVDVRRVLESTINMAWNEIRHRAVLVRDFQEVPPIIANASRLAQVFLNLLVNAAQALPEGEVSENEILVSVASVPGGEGRVVVTVRDTGSGIGAADLTRIFDPFYTTKPVGVGTGLGLSICHGIVTALGGEIRVDSELGVGTTFRVYLPAA